MYKLELYAINRSSMKIFDVLLFLGTDQLPKTIALGNDFGYVKSANVELVTFRPRKFGGGGPNISFG